MIDLLDCNAWVAIVRKKYPQVAARYGASNRADIRSCSVVFGLCRTPLRLREEREAGSQPRST